MRLRRLFDRRKPDEPAAARPEQLGASDRKTPRVLHVCTDCGGGAALAKAGEAIPDRPPATCIMERWAAWGWCRTNQRGWRPLRF